MNPKIRQTIYQVGTIIPALLGILLIWGGIDAGTADNIAQVLAGVVALIGAAAPATAAVKVNQQRKDGTLASPAEQVLRGVEAVVAAKNTAQAEFDRVQQAVVSTISDVPALGPLATQILNLDYRPK